jgi:hypothetical protein
MLSGTLAFESAASASSATPGLLANMPRRVTQAPTNRVAPRQRHLPLPMGSATLLAAIEPFSQVAKLGRVLPVSKPSARRDSTP